MSPTAAEALDRLAPDWGVVINGNPIDLPALVGDRPTVLEIGPGMGEATLVCAAADPTRCILAVDVHTPGLGRLLREADRAGLGNVRIGIGDAVDLLRDHIPTGWLDGVRIWFPDPWPKARHHKRRLIDPDFVALLADRVRPSGLAHLATDWPDYAEQMTAVLDAAPDWIHVATGTNRRLLDRPETGYERRAAGTGRPVTDLVFRRVP
jgi:tRNA (guanine-N7-)-methyltransferase